MATPGVTLVDSNGVTISFSTGLPVTVLAGSGINATQATTNTAIAAGTASNTTLKASAGRLFSVTVTTAGTVAPMNFTDGPGGTVIFSLATAAAIGTYAITGGVPFSTSLIAVGLATNPAVTVSFA